MALEQTDTTGEETIFTKLFATFGKLALNPNLTALSANYSSSLSKLRMGEVVGMELLLRDVWRNSDFLKGC